jgi:hypothetical protein
MDDLDDFLATTLSTPLEPYTLRVTHAYRREDGEWKIVHRHADSVPATQGSPPASTVPP